MEHPSTATRATISVDTETLGGTFLDVFRGRGWVMHMTWHDLLFAHWPLPPEAIQTRLPRGMTVDTFDGRAWLGVVPFRMTDIHLRGLPAVPTAEAFVELNVRTYVRVADRPGVYFFSLDAPHPLPIAAARAAYKLNYQRATMKCWTEADWIAYRSMRRRGDAMWVSRHRPTGPAQPTSPGSLTHWLTDRYRMYMSDRHGRLWRAEIAHEPWQLSDAEAMIDLNTMTRPLGLALPGQPPHLLFARRMVTRVGRPRRVGVTPVVDAASPRRCPSAPDPSPPARARAWRQSGAREP